jgi:hypothetical protein
MSFDKTLTMSLAFRIHGLHFYYPSLPKNRSGQRFPPQSSENNIRSNDAWNEIDRRNQRILYPLNAKESYGKQDYHSTFDYQKTKLQSNSFNLEAYNSYYRRQRLTQRNSEHIINNSTIYLQKIHEKQILLTSNNNNNSSLLYGNSFIKTNKAIILKILEEKQLTTSKNSTTYIDKHGVVIGEDGPFWPHDFRILYPTPKLLSRELTPKEFYLTVTNSLLSSKSTYNNNNVKK